MSLRSSKNCADLPNARHGDRINNGSADECYRDTFAHEEIDESLSAPYLLVPPPPHVAKRTLRVSLYCVQVAFCILVGWMVLFNLGLFVWYGMQSGGGPAPGGLEKDVLDRLPLEPSSLIQHLIDSLSDQQLFLYDPEVLNFLSPVSSERDEHYKDSVNAGYSTRELLEKRKFVLFGIIGDTLSCMELLDRISGFLCGDMAPNVWLRPLPQWSTLSDLTLQIHLFNRTYLPRGTQSIKKEYFITKPNPEESFIHSRDDLQMVDCQIFEGVRIKCPIHWDRFGSEDARFAECNRTGVEMFYDRYPEQRQVALSSATQRFRLTVRLMLEAASNALDRLDIPFWISSSVALGWYRQCDVIPYSKDVDIGIFAEYYSATIVPALEDSGLELKMSLGLPEQGLQLAFYSKGVKLDIYFFYKSDSPGSIPGGGNLIWNAATRPEDGARFRYWFPEFGTCWTVFLDLLVRTPCPIQPYITANYGPNWSVPVSEWNWDRSATNVEDWGVWPQESLNETVQVYGISLDER